MITLRYSNQVAELNEVEEKLKALSLAYKLEQQQDLKVLQLSDSGILLEGKEAIQQHIEKIERELKQWWYCDC